jgi:hypothetical protein
MSISVADIVRRSREAPGGRGWINGGFFVLERRVLDYIEGDDTYFQREPLERLARDGQLAAYRHEGFWQCMDTMRDRDLLNSLWDGGNPPWRTWDEPTGPARAPAALSRRAAAPSPRSSSSTGGARERTPPSVLVARSRSPPPERLVEPTLGHELADAGDAHESRGREVVDGQAALAIGVVGLPTPFSTVQRGWNAGSASVILAKLTR